MRLFFFPNNIVEMSCFVLSLCKTAFMFILLEMTNFTTWHKIYHVWDLVVCLFNNLTHLQTKFMKVAFLFNTKAIYFKLL